MIDYKYVGSQEWVIGLLLTHGATTTNIEIMNTLPSNAFTVHLLKDAFKAAKALADKANAIDLITVDDFVTRTLSRASQELHPSQFARLAEVQKNTMPNTDIKTHANQIMKGYKVRQLIKAMNDSFDCINNGTDIDDILESVENSLSSVKSSNDTYQTVRVSEMTDTYLTYLESKLEDSGIRTGFTDCDKAIGTAKPGNMIVVAARPSMGKTEYACAWGCDAALRQHKHVLVFTMEMENNEIMDRFVALEANIESRELDDPSKLDENKYAKIGTALQSIEKGKMSLHEEPAMTVSKMKAVIKSTESEHGKIDIVIIDYIQLMKDPSQKSNRISELAQISRDIKAMAKDFKMPFVVLAQLNRDCEKENRDPRPSDIKECGQIEQDADKIFFLHNPDVSNPASPNNGLIKFIAAKARQGKKGVTCLNFVNGHFYDTNREFLSKDDMKEINGSFKKQKNTGNF